MVIPVKRKPGRDTKNSLRAAGKLPVVEAPVVASDAGDDSSDSEAATPTKRKPGRPKGSLNKKPAKGKTTKGKSVAKTKSLPVQVQPKAATEMSGPIPVAGSSKTRSGHFDYPLPVPPIDVDGFQRVFTHDILVNNYFISSAIPLIIIQATFLRWLRFLYSTRHSL